MTKKKNTKAKIGISIGDINGIGPEVILKTLQDNRIAEICTPIIYGSAKLLQQYRKHLQLNHFNFSKLEGLDKVNAKKNNLINLWDEELTLEMGKPTPLGGKYAFQSLEAATNDLIEQKIDALVTAPIDKKTIQTKDFQFPGHTEYLQAKCEAEDSLMLMVSEYAKIGVVTGHIPLENVAQSIHTDLILKKITILNKSLKDDFGIRKPKIALLGLNPHAGDNGLLGKEEEEIIAPALKQAKSIDILAFGPFPADGFFGSSAYRQYDGILAMYHDQGLIPAKSLAFGSGVNFTAGLPIVRTSPDHGTAYEIAGKNQANASSFRSAIYLACDVVKNRRLQEEFSENPLVVSKNRK